MPKELKKLIEEHKDILQNEAVQKLATMKDPLYHPLEMAEGYGTKSKDILKVLNPIYIKALRIH